MESAIPVVKELSEHYDIYIATAVMEVPASFTDKFEWLKQHFPFLNQLFIFCGNKRVVHADYLIDDTLSRLDAFTETGGTGILYKAYHNEGTQTNHRKVNSWIEIQGYFIKQREKINEEAKKLSVQL